MNAFAHVLDNSTLVCEFYFIVYMKKTTKSFYHTTYSHIPIGAEGKTSRKKGRLYSCNWLRRTGRVRSRVSLKFLNRRKQIHENKTISIFFTGVPFRESQPAV